jgi:uncharacterized protein (TIGR02594 family)
MNPKIPVQYQWLEQEGAPGILVEALKHIGTLEHKGKDNNPDITKWADEIGGKVEDVYTNDEIPWCGLFLAICVKRARGLEEVVKDPLWALNWGTYGTKADTPKLGDVLTFVRKTSTGATAGHVAIYIGEDATAYHVLGGNQSDSVCITRIAKTRMYAARRTKWSIAQPANVRKIILASNGKLSKNEQ